MSIQNADYTNINLDEMAASIGLKAKHMPMLIGSFIEESSEVLLALKIAVEENDFEGIKSCAHSIKGSAGNLKFNELYEMSREMEVNAVDENSDFEYKKYFDAIQAAFSTIPN